MVIEFKSAYEPISTGVIKSYPEDFIVEEQLDWDFSDSGEHLYCKIRKTGLATLEVIDKLAAHIGCRSRDIGYAGLKDKHAITTQWISIPFKYNTYDTDWLNQQGIEVLQTRRHLRKLRQGNLKANSFLLRVRQIKVSHDRLQERIETLANTGFPNYFGQQRFGRNYQTLSKALALLESGQYKRLTHKNGFYLSCLRSYLFNRVLSERVDQKVWNQLLAGDILQLAGTHSVFVDDGQQQNLSNRHHDGDIHPAGLLWGSKALSSRAAAKAIELTALADVQQVLAGIEKVSLKAGYRAFAAYPSKLRMVEYNQNECLLSFDLLPGQYATELLKNIFHLS